MAEDNKLPATDELKSLTRLPGPDGTLNNAKISSSVTGQSSQGNASSGTAKSSNSSEIPPLAVDKTPFDTKNLPINEKLRFPVHGMDMKTAPIGGRSHYGMRNDPTSNVRGTKRFHNGTDVQVPEGTPLIAMGNGVVVPGMRQGGRQGNNVTVRYKDAQGRNVDVVYMHMSTNTLPPGTPVHAGEVIGKVGNTGVGTGAHLHMGMQVDGKWIDPEKYDGY